MIWAHVTRNKKNIKKETKTNKRQCHLVWYKFKIREGSPKRNQKGYAGFVKEMSFKPGVKGRGNER